MACTSRPCIALAALAFVSGLTACAPAGDEQAIPVGASYSFEIEGNPSTGYVWKLNEAKSENPAIVRVEDLGYGEPKKSEDGKIMVGAPAPYRFNIVGLSPGSAKLRFDYLRPWVGTPERTQDLAVRVDE